MAKKPDGPIKKRTTLREQAEAQLRTLNTRLDFLLSSSPATIYTCESVPLYAPTFISANLTKMLGYTVKKFLATPGFWADHIHPDDRDRVFAGIPRLYAQGTHLHEYRFQHRDGRWRWMSAALSVVPGPDDKARELIGYFIDITERNKAERALRSSESRLNEAQRLAQIGSWELDLRANNLTWSNEIYRIFEIDPVAFQASYEGFLNLVHPDDREMVDRAYSDSVASRTPYDITHRLLMKDGRIKFVQERGQTDYMPDGTPERSLGIVQDITERKQREDALQFLSTRITHLSGEAFFSEMAVQVSQLLGLEIGFVDKLLATPTPRIRAIGLSIDGQAQLPVEYDLAGTPCERVIGKQTAIFPEQVQELFPDDRMLVDLGVSSYAAIPLFDMSGRPIGHVGVMSRRPLRQVKQVEDILRLFAVRAAAELERQRTETKFHDLFEFSPDAIIMVNQEGLITLANRQAESLFGHSRAEFLGLPVETLMPKARGQGNMELRQQFLSAATPRIMGTGSFELHALKKDGTIFPIDISLSPIQTEYGLLVVAAVRDITERKRAEEVLRQREAKLRIAIEDRERISQDLHDGILQSLFAVGLGLETAKATMSPRTRKTSGPLLNQTIDQLNCVMREIRNFIVGLGSDPLQGKDLPTALRHMVTALTQNQPVRVRLAIEDRALQAVSPGQVLHVFRVMQEAVSNCIRHGCAQEVTLSLKMLKRGVRLSIRDNGSGFNPEVAKTGGHGLINMAARAQKIGGRFTVFSKINEGTRIVFDLPKEAFAVHR